MEINARCLKITLMSCISEFTHLINLCSDKSYFPLSWKTAIVVPIPKQGYTKNIDNLRPISLIPVTGKILERFINDFIIDHMESNRLFLF